MKKIIIASILIITCLSCFSQIPERPNRQGRNVGPPVDSCHVYEYAPGVFYVTLDSGLVISDSTIFEIENLKNDGVSYVERLADRSILIYYRIYGVRNRICRVITKNIKSN